MFSYHKKENYIDTKILVLCFDETSRTNKSYPVTASNLENHIKHTLKDKIIEKKLI